jgi:hypothetical protein
MARRLDEIRERAGADRHSTRDSFPESDHGVLSTIPNSSRVGWVDPPADEQLATHALTPDGDEQSEAD